MTSQRDAIAEARASAPASNAQAAPAQRPCRLCPHLFTADELPMPPAKMRLPPGEEAEETLFDGIAAE